ncbi:hypothetical protein M378DRAFT_158972 [Amanita muscaria Koide BX008]|uniref:Uncharacterized protein n=1 Tax=Amanita muscaria (strain Koide BX008) TaxID=946122 RepID=A0A0C2TL22_AMAMK|nr:hypothetical protein M378DRAFT_158972 [Amanita muscaria Koide BX008]
MTIRWKCNIKSIVVYSQIKDRFEDRQIFAFCVIVIKNDQRRRLSLVCVGSTLKFYNDKSCLPNNLNT